MSVRLNPVEHQIIVITGASSGIGLATARDAAARGARVVLVARNEEAMRKIADEINAEGGRAIAAPADVAKHEDLERVARTAVEAVGGFDTWVNDASVALYGIMDQIPIEDQRRLFEVNYWGIVYGSLIAAKHLRRRGGAIINVGSVLSDRAMIYQGQYSAAKHAVMGFTEALRMELEADGAPVSVTLIKPAAIDTPFPEHARNYLDAPSPALPPPTYDPHLVARAILYAAEHQRRTLVIGFGGFAISALGNLFPRLTDFIMEATGRSSQTSADPGPRERRDNLYEPRQDHAEHSTISATHRRTSLFLEAQLRPVTTVLLLAGLGLAAAQVLRGRDRSDRPDDRFRRYRELRRRSEERLAGNPAHGPGRRRLAQERRPTGA